MPAESGLTVMLSELIEGLPTGIDCPVSDVVQDSRKVGPGSLFLARAGGTTHGLSYMEDVLDKGVAAIAAEPSEQWPLEKIEQLAADSAVPVVAVEGLGFKASGIAARFFTDPSEALLMVGITGTNGKTSCSHAMAQAMGSETRAAVIGTLGNGEPSKLQAATHTTPDAVELQRMLSDFSRQGIETVAMEVSSHALDQGRVAAVKFDMAVFTNLSRDHLDYHGDMESYGEAKAKLFQMSGLRVAIINGDDAYAETLVEKIADDVRVVIYGLQQPSDKLLERADSVLIAQQLETTSEGIVMVVRRDGETVELKSRWMGYFNGSNLLAVLAVLLESGMKLSDALQQVSDLPVVGGRMEPFGGGDKPSVVVDYAHTPDALEQVLTALRSHSESRLICVFGCGGGRDRGKRRLMGAVAARLADAVIVTDDNPRYEDGDEIVADILEGMDSTEVVKVERNRAKAIAMGIAEARPGDIVAVCGKGHETTQQVGDLVHEFDDREQVMKQLGVAN